MKQRCSICHSEFSCGPKQGELRCWCNALPAIMPADFLQDCRCPSCLTQVIVERIDQSIKSNSHPQMLEIASEYRDQGELTEHIDYTIEKGHYVFSKWYHLKRGHCCGNGCRHCPYSDVNQD